MRKLLISILLGLVTLFSFAPYWQAFAQSSSGTTGTWYNQDFNSWAGKVYDKNNPSDIFGERYTAAQVQWVIYGLFAFLFKSTPAGDLVICLLSNTDPTSCDTQKLIDQLKQIQSAAQKAGTYQNIQNQSLASLIFSQDRPISGIGYVKDKLQNFNLVSTAHAQTPGFGYVTALKPIQGFWGAVRNVSYGLFVLISITFAFLIMFRVKLSPQTVISVQSALPKIIVALVAATFSYAIAGFLIDAMYIVIGIFSLMFTGFFSNTFLSFARPQNYFALMTTGILWTGIYGTLAISGIFFFLPIILIILTAGGVIAIFSGGVGGLIILIGLAIIVVIYLWIAIKTIWTLIKTFAMLLLNIIFSPLTLTLGTLIPTFSLGAWIKNIISQLAVFITVGVLSTLSMLFSLESFALAIQTSQQDWLKNMGGQLIMTVLSLFGGAGLIIGNVINNAMGFNGSTPGWPPLLGMGGGSSVALIMWAVSFVLFTMIPKSAELIQSFIQGKPFAYGSAIGEALTPAPLRFGYRASGLPGALEILQSQRAYGALYNMAGTQDKPLYGLFKLANPKWDAAAQEIARRAGVDVDLH